MLDKNKLLKDLFQAYYKARKNKRKTLNVAKFEVNLESNIFKLYDELVSWTLPAGRQDYKISKSICFIINDPVKREIYAWYFRDRIVHHLIYNYIYDICESEFIYDSYSCRLNKWTHFWIRRVDHFIRSCSQNYSKDCYILKMDVSWFFMNINKNILFQKIQDLLSKHKEKLEIDYAFLLNLIKKVIYNDPTQNSIFKWNKSDYDGLPTNKCLSGTPQNKWLPIWNLTSQLFANIYLDSFDKFVKKDLWCKYYGRYVDDFVIIHPDKEYLKSIIPKISAFLDTKLQLELHPKKIYFQDYSKWVLFLGWFIKPHRIYIRKRTIWNFYKKIQYVNQLLNPQNTVDLDKKDEILSIVNSYLWNMKHYKSYKIRKKIFRNIDNRFWYYFNYDKDIHKIKTLAKKVK